MAEEEPQVERRVARVGTLEIQQDQALACTRMFLGLKSPRTSVRSDGRPVHRRRSSARMRSARSG